MNVRLHGESGTNGEPQDVGIPDLGGSEVDLASVVDLLVERLIDRVAGLQSEADQPQLGRNWKLESLVLSDELSKILSKFDLSKID